MSLVEFSNITYKYNVGEDDEFVALSDCSFCIEEGSKVCVLGHNGSGKSTVAKLLNGLFTPISGKVVCCGYDTADPKTAFELRKNVGVVFQNPDNQMVASIIEDDVAFGPENIGLDRAEIGERISWALNAVGMSDYRDKTPFRLSGGQKQRIAIAGVLALRPKVLVLDEATSMLDPQGRREVLNILNELRRNFNITVIMITHYMEEAVDADKIIILNKGEVVYDGGNTVFKEPQLLKEWGLDLPMPSKLANSLGLNGGESNILSILDLVEALCQK